MEEVWRVEDTHVDVLDGSVAGKGDAMPNIMHIEDCRMMNHGTRNTALFFERYAYMVKPDERAYYLAMCRLIAEDPEMFFLHAFDGADIRFCDFKRKGKTLSYCRAYYAVKPVSLSEGMP